MNRIFHVKIAGGTYLFLILLTAVMVFAFWCMKAMIVLIHYEKKNLLSLVPVKPEEFINALVKRLEHRIEEE